MAPRTLHRAGLRRDPIAAPERRRPPDPEDPARPRLFFAVPLPDEVRASIRPVRDAVQAAVGDGHARIRWVRIESLHITLRFLGPTSLDEAPALAAATDDVAAASRAFDVAIEGAGAFPDARRPRTLWLGIRRGATELADLATAIGVRTGGPEERPFAAHLTVARTDGLRLGGAAADALIAASAGRSWAFRADRIVLFRSHLGEGPAWYEPIHEAALAG